MPPLVRRLSATLAAAALVLFAAGPFAHADSIVNTIDTTVDSAQESVTIASGASVVVDFYVNAENLSNDANGCNATGAEKATATVSVPAGVSASPTTVVFSGCGSNASVPVKFTSTSPGTYVIGISQVTGGKPGSTWNLAPAEFTLIVTGDTTPPMISYVVNPSSPNGNSGWYTSTVSVSWSVTDPESAVTKTGCVNQTITADQDATIYSCSASSAGGSAGPVAVTIKRDATGPTVTWTGGPAEGGSYVYGAVPAAPMCAAVDALSGPGSCSVNGYSADAGTHTMTASASDVAGNPATASRTYTVTKATSTVNLTCPASVTYDGSPQEPCTATVTGAGGLDDSVSVTYTNNTNAGTATASASYAGDANHEPSSNSTSFEITKAASTVTVTCAAGPFVYSGAAHEPCSATVTGVGGLDQALTVTYANNTNAGTATASASYAGDPNHEPSSDSTSFEISKASSTVTVICPSNVVYTGSAQTPCSATVSGVGSDVTQDVTWVYSDNVNAGSASATATYAGDANHEGSSGSSTFTIDKAPSTVTVTCPTSVVYTGTAYEPCTATATGAGGLDESLVVSYSDNVNAGSATASATYAGDANHTGSTGSSTFTIDKASSTVTVTCPTSVVFTGSPITPCTATATGVGGLSLPLTVTYTANTAVGTATASASYAGDANHLGSTGSATFQIAAWTLSGFYQPVDMSGVWNVVKNGSTVPLKFEVYAGPTELTDVSVVSTFTVKSVSCPGTTAVNDDIELTTTGGTQLRYDSTGGQFIQNWQTPKRPGTCWIVTMTTDDGSSLSANFKLK